MRRLSASARNRLRQQEDWCDHWFLFLAHLQNRLVGVRDNSKVLNYFCMLLTRERFRSLTKLGWLIMELRYWCTTYFIRDEEYHF